MLQEVNSTFVTLVAKKENPNGVVDYKLIVCCGVVYKCIAKKLSLRIKFLLKFLIYPCQYAFVDGRSIQENIMLSHEIVRNYHRPIWTPRCTLKIDLRKVYDTNDTIPPTNSSITTTKPTIGFFSIYTDANLHRLYTKSIQEGFHIKSATNQLQVPAGPDTPTEILENPRFYPYFKDCIGAIDGIQIPAMVGLDEQVPFWCRKGFISQNVLVACSFDLQFQYVLAGWEGLAADSRILDSTLTRCDRLIVPEGKFYLADAGFANMPQFITPYRGVRYHLKEFGGNLPKDAKELFNLRHASLRNAIERAIGILKRRFTILQVQPQYPFESQVKIVLACCILYNHIRRECINDLIFDDENLQNLLETDPRMQQDSECHTLGRNKQREVASELRTSIADTMWNDYQRRRRD
ncbi:hypothetical protein MKW98_018293 [Papaver atlanticum]|uniref:DDE Tnp4 domain-containing protein n=1 Tax=Papaver atlanticum TaxID=357466 RepID=A0AAD4T3Q2_9MAGN|nr:hypothetical protein MKW98_018293 [Papaver atlanticum]